MSSKSERFPPSEWIAYKWVRYSTELDPKPSKTDWALETAGAQLSWTPSSSSSKSCVFFHSPETAELPMAACTFGGSSVKISDLKLGFGRIKLVTLQSIHGLRSRTPFQYPSLVLSNQSGNGLIGCRCSSEAKPVANSEDDSEEAKCTTSELIPNSYEVECLLNQICDTSSIAEFEIKLGGFRLYALRDLTGKSKPTSPPISAPVNTSTTVEAPDQNGCVASPSLAISKPVPSSSGVQSLLDRAVDEGLAILKAPRVGYFRTSRTVKGKRLPPLCQEGQTVKQGKVVCFVEQFGGVLPVVCDTSGEVIKILREDGEPVGYGDALMAILPSFPGIKMLQ
ncbi:hypothetical protein Vadar_027295 [Vaccinium darrowii]|uniref:Uncharacterized protein n=1 Tax=Vaccinium darrowii TaxID=229202 RepID=A0ACB7ZN97_9ERIC|nr:hypothetical protein Vadar_027295 [Vaccinium darrowii]